MVLIAIVLRLNKMQAQLEELKSLTRNQLARRWQECFGVPAPHLSRSEILRQAIAWHLQTKALGGLTLQEKRKSNPV